MSADSIRFIVIVCHVCEDKTAPCKGASILDRLSLCAIEFSICHVCVHVETRQHPLRELHVDYTRLTEDSFSLLSLVRVNSAAEKKIRPPK